MQPNCSSGFSNDLFRVNFWIQVSKRNTCLEVLIRSALCLRRVFPGRVFWGDCSAAQTTSLKKKKKKKLAMLTGVHSIPPSHDGAAAFGISLRALQWGDGGRVRVQKQKFYFQRMQSGAAI